MHLKFDILFIKFFKQSTACLIYFTLSQIVISLVVYTFLDSSTVLHLLFPFATTIVVCIT